MVTLVSSRSLGLFTLAGASLLSLVIAHTEDVPLTTWHSPYEVAFSPDGSLVATSDRTAASLWLVNATEKQVERRVALHGEPTGVAWAADGKHLWVSLSGVHEIAKLDLARLESYLAGGLPDEHRLARRDKRNPGTESVRLRIRRDEKLRFALANDLAALTSAGLIERIPVTGLGPRGLAVSPDGSVLATAAYYSGKLLFLDAKDDKAA